MAVIALYVASYICICLTELINPYRKHKLHMYTKISTDVVSANTWTNWAPMAQCGATGTITQNHTSSCQPAVFECSSICTGGRTTQRTIAVPLCCARTFTALNIRMAWVTFIR